MGVGADMFRGLVVFAWIGVVVVTLLALAIAGGVLWALWLGLQELFA